MSHDDDRRKFALERNPLESVDPLVRQAVNPSIRQSVNPPVRHSVTPQVRRSIKLSIRLSVNPSMSVLLTVNPSIRSVTPSEHSSSSLATRSSAAPDSHGSRMRENPHCLHAAAAQEPRRTGRPLAQHDVQLLLALLERACRKGPLTNHLPTIRAGVPQLDAGTPQVGLAKPATKMAGAGARRVAMSTAVRL